MCNLKRFKMPFKVLKQVYYNLVYSYLNYNACCYCSAYDTHLEKLIVLQKRVIRVMNGVPPRTHTSPLFYSNGLLKIQDIYNLNVGLFMYDQQLSGQFIRTHDYNTRNRDSLLPNQVRRTVCEHSLLVAGPNIWNSIPINIQNATSRSSFKKRYKNYLLSFYVDRESI